MKAGISHFTDKKVGAVVGVTPNRIVKGSRLRLKPKLYQLFQIFGPRNLLNLDSTRELCSCEKLEGEL